MNFKYTAYHFNVEPKEPGVEILMALLGEKPFESFIETDFGLSAYVQENLDSETILNDVFILQSEDFKISYTKEFIEQVNWNQEWEKNFESITVDDICYVRAPFHQPKEVPYEIVIEPKMSFGTGHHETTFLMMKYLLKLHLENKTVLDMGCGTAILAILARMRGAKKAIAIDIDNWCYLNSMENAQRNAIDNIEFFEGDASILQQYPSTFDLVIANINRNILLEDMEHYTKTMKEESDILFSGFYTQDIEIITQKANEYGLHHIETLEKNNWVALHFKKN